MENNTNRWKTLVSRLVEQLEESQNSDLLLFMACLPEDAKEFLYSYYWEEKLRNHSMRDICVSVLKENGLNTPEKKWTKTVASLPSVKRELFIIEFLSATLGLENKELGFLAQNQK